MYGAMVRGGDGSVCPCGAWKNSRMGSEKVGYALGDASDLVQPLWRQGFLEEASVRTLRTL